MNDSLTEGLERGGLVVGERSCRLLVRYLEELLRWNRRVNLTAVTDWRAAIEKHLIDSLHLLPLLGDAHRLLDMGSGAGLPGIPLQIARPDLEVVSVDSVGKKINFQRHIKRLLELKNFFPVQGRLEHLTDCLSSAHRFDLITARAFSSLENIVRLSTFWLSPEGKILVMKGPEGEKEVEEARGELEGAGVVVADVHRYRLPVSDAERQVIVIVNNNLK